MADRFRGDDAEFGEMTAQGVHAQGMASIDGQAITDESVSRIVEVPVKQLCHFELEQVGLLKIVSRDTRKLYSKVRARHSNARTPSSSWNSRSVRIRGTIGRMGTRLGRAQLCRLVL